MDVVKEEVKLVGMIEEKVRWRQVICCGGA